MMMITNKHKAYLILAITFLLGTLFGASGQYMLTSQTAPKSGRSVHEVTLELSRRLSLDPTQELRVEQVFNETQQQYQEVRNQMKPQFAVIRENARKQIREMLSADQQVRFAQWTKEMDEKREREAQKKN